MKVCVIGSGSWGTALSQVLADAGHSVMLHARREEVVQGINEEHRNPDYLSGSTLPQAVRASTSYETCLEGADACVVVTPSAYLRSTAQSMKDHCPDDLPIIICSKGVEAKTGKLPAEVMADVLGSLDRFAVLSGPTHAEEVIRRLPSSAVAAAVSADVSRLAQDLFSTGYFRTYASDDIVGVELCGAFKNVIAIAVGISYGLKLGDNTAAAIITRGLAEMSRMVQVCGGEAITCMGLAGAGDMVVTCLSRHSRNRRFGEDYIARGLTLEDFEHDTHMVVEGAIACKTLDVLSKRHGVELPLTDAVRAVVWEGGDAKALGHELMDRPLKSEF
ncbi:MAG: NAD(P)-dependent glycerol-3-phosphate dehydrogenase [Eggerthellaceae bacterium]|nr:NAD(P)-dependent glycerol-3-phosphate dehydrogenase [Eggerthellaceae bacterium]